MVFKLQLFFSLTFLFVGSPNLAQELYVGSGARTGEITSSSAIVRVRLTSVPEQDANGHIPGTNGLFRIRYDQQPQFSQDLYSSWVAIDSTADFSAQVELTNLTASTRYYYQVEFKKSRETQSQLSEVYSFLTAPAPEARESITFQVTSCQDLKGDSTYWYMAQQQPAFLVSTGDNVYYDSDDAPVKARTVAMAYKFYQQMYGKPLMKDYFASIGGYFQKDDHDYRFNDADPCQTIKGLDGGYVTDEMLAQNQKWLTHQEGVKVFKDVWPMSDTTYRTFRWGKGVQIWLLEGRDYRSCNAMPDGPDKTLLGSVQLNWLKTSLQQSDADYRIVISPDSHYWPRPAYQNG